MFITISTSISFKIPEESSQLEEFNKRNNIRDWHRKDTSNRVTFRRRQMFQVGDIPTGEITDEQTEDDD